MHCRHPQNMLRCVINPVQRRCFSHQTVGKYTSEVKAGTRVFHGTSLNILSSITENDRIIPDSESIGQGVDITSCPNQALFASARELLLFNQEVSDPINEKDLKEEYCGIVPFPVLLEIEIKDDSPIYAPPDFDSVVDPSWTESIWWENFGTALIATSGGIPASWIVNAHYTISPHTALNFGLKSAVGWAEYCFAVTEEQRKSDYYGFQTLETDWRNEKGLDHVVMTPGIDADFKTSLVPWERQVEISNDCIEYMAIFGQAIASSPIASRTFKASGGETDSDARNFHLKQNISQVINTL